MRAITWSRKSLNDVQKIGEYVRSFNPAREQTVVDEIFKTADLLLALPRLGKLYEEELPEEIEAGMRSIVADRRYRIIYKVSSVDAVEVMRVVDVRSSYQK